MHKDTEKIASAERFAKGGYTPITTYRNCRSQGRPIQKCYKKFLNDIRDGKYKKQIEEIRSESNKTAQSYLKLKLPAAVFGGVYLKVRELYMPSGLACLDFDNVEFLDDLKDKLKKDKYVLCFFVSPSGNGIKAIIKIPYVAYDKHYKEYYKAALEHFKNLNPDKSTSNMNRLCFVSYDPDIYLNYDSEVFTKKIEIPKIVAKPFRRVNNLPEGHTIDRILKWWTKRYTFSEGSRNNSIYVLACAFSEYGIFKERAKELLAAYASNDFTIREINALIASAYRRTNYNSKSF